MDEEKVLGVVARVVRKGKHGPYAISYAKNSAIREALVTFSLAVPCWVESTIPERGVLVVLTDITKKRAGWRAGSARYVRVADAEFVAEHEGGRSHGDI